MTRARCPASSANLGPGFDVLSLAVELYVEVSAEPAAQFSIRTEGEGADFPADETHFCAQVARHVAGNDHFSFTVSSQIPPGRGLGSSAALAVATAAALGADDPFAVATSLDGHPENAAASVFGGLVAATLVDGVPIARPLPLDDELRFVVVIPDRTLATHEARAALPESVSMQDATFNLGRMGLLVAGLGDRSQLVSDAGDDRLHQRQRSALFPEAPELLERLRRAGAIVACWSGAGPSLLAICGDGEFADTVRDAAEVALADLGVAGRAIRLQPDRVGLVIEA